MIKQRQQMKAKRLQDVAEISAWFREHQLAQNRCLMGLRRTLADVIKKRQLRRVYAGSLLLALRGHPPAGIDFFVAKLVVCFSRLQSTSSSRLAVGISEGNPRLQSTSLWGHPPTSSWRSLLVGFRWHPTGCKEALRGEICCWVSGGCSRPLSWRTLFVGLGNGTPQSAGMLFRLFFLFLLSV